MGKEILVVNGHPDPRHERFCAALCDAFAEGATSGGWHVERLDIGSLTLAPPPDKAGAPNLHPSVIRAIEQIRKADRLAIVFPLWLDAPPGGLRDVFEGFARSVWSHGEANAAYEKPARVIVTMDMPAFIQRSRFYPEQKSGAGLSLSLPGVQATEPLFIGGVQTITPAQREEWLQKVKLLAAHDD